MVRLRAEARHVFLVDLHAGAADDGAVAVDVPAHYNITSLVTKLVTSIRGSNALLA